MLEISGLSTKFLKKETFCGSHCGMRYTIKKTDNGIIVFVYAEPWSFEKTPEDKRLVQEFDFSDDGVANAVQWLENTYITNRKFWDTADKEKMANMLSEKFPGLPE